MTDSSDHGFDSSFKPELPAPPALYQLSLVKVRSFLVVSQRHVLTRQGNLEELTAFAREVLTGNLALGWWGFPFGLIWTPMALVSNHKALKKLRELASDGKAAAGWFPDPSGRHGARYWDGSAWTERVTDEGTDELSATQDA